MAEKLRHSNQPQISAPDYGELHLIHEQFQLISNDILTRLSEERLIPRHDAAIAERVVNELEQRLHSTTDVAYQRKIVRAATSLDSLVPAWKNDDSETGARVIAEKVISPGIEKLIASRQHADIVNLDLRQYRGEVQWALVDHAYFVVEGVNACTVACSYCPVADIGPISKRFDYKSIKQLMMLNQKRYTEKGFLVAFSAFYNNTDMFDWEELDDDGNIIDYTQILKDYRDFLFKTPIDKYTNQPIGSSTSIPWGTELRVLDSVLYLGSLKDTVSRSYLSSMRISVNNANLKRALAIKEIADSLSHLKKHKSYGLSLSPNHDESHLESGKGRTNWQERAQHMSLQDILSIECADKVVFSPNGIRNDFGVALTEESRTGNRSVPFIKTLSDGSVEYWVIHNSLYINEENAILESTGYQEILDFPDPTFTVIPYDTEGNQGNVHTEIIDNDPARILFKLCRLLAAEFLIKDNPSDDDHRMVFSLCGYNDMPITVNPDYEKQKDMIEVQQRVSLIRKHAQRLQEYLDEGHTNHVMSMVLSQIQPLLS